MPENTERDSRGSHQRSDKITVPHTPDSSFPRESRLTAASQYRKVFEKNHRTADKHWTILYRANDDGAARLGMAVAKKNAKRAVDRNRLKRLARESFRQHKKSLAGFDIVLMIRHASVSAGNEELYKGLEAHWSRIAKNA